MHESVIAICAKWQHNRACLSKAIQELVQCYDLPMSKEEQIAREIGKRKSDWELHKSRENTRARRVDLARPTIADAEAEAEIELRFKRFEVEKRRDCTNEDAVAKALAYQPIRKEINRIKRRPVSVIRKSPGPSSYNMLLIVALCSVLLKHDGSLPYSLGRRKEGIDGPTVRVIKAALNLYHVNVSDNTIAHAIRRARLNFCDQKVGIRDINPEFVVSDR